jgi:tetratricopeptide (TPR) repeat protein
MSGHIVYGQALFDAQQFEEARTVFDTALTLDPENLIALRQLGDIARALNEPDTARSWYQRVLEADPRNEEIAAILTELAAGAPESATPAAQPADTGPSGTVVIEALRLDDLEPTAMETEAQEAPEPVAETAPSELPAESERELPVTEVIEAVHLGAPASEPEAEPPAAPAPPAEELLDLEDFQVQPETPVAPRISTPRASLHEMGMEIERSDDESFVPGNTGDEAPAEEPEAPAEEEPVAAEWAEPEEELTLDEFEVPASPASPAAAESAPADPFATETMAELYLRQGHDADALRVYRQLLGARPGDPGLQAKVAELEARTAEAEAPEAPAAPQDVPDLDASGFDLETPVAAASAVPEPEPSIEEFTLPEPEPEAEAEPVALEPDVVAAEPEVVPTPVAAATPVTAATPVEPAAAVSSGPSIREFLLGLAGRSPAGENAIDVVETPVEVEVVATAVVEEVAETAAVAIESAPEPSPAERAANTAAAAAVFAEPAPAEPPPSVSSGGSIDGLFGGAGVSFDDQNAASTLAGAFGAGEEGAGAGAGTAPTPATPMTGAPARRATEELSLDSVFREPSGSNTPERPGFSFDRFFSGGTPAQGTAASETPARGTAPESPDDDIEQFNSWLDGLKKR